MKYFNKAFIVGLFFSVLAPSQATTFSISVADLENGLEDAQLSGANPGQFLIDKIQGEIEDAGLNFSNGDIVFTNTDTFRDTSHCSYKYTGSIDTTITIDGRTNIELIISSLKEPIVASADLFGNIDINGKAKLRLGAMVLGKCIRYQTDHIKLDGGAELQLSIETVLSLNPVLSADKKSISFTPTLDIDGEIFVFKANLRISDLEVWGGIGQIFQIAINQILANKTDISPDAFNNDFKSLLNQKETELLGKIRSKMGGPTATYVFPPIESLVDDLGGALASNGVNPVPVAYEYLEQNAGEILYAYLVGDEELLRTLLADPVACEASKILRVNLDHMPVYQYSNGSCSAVSGNISDTNTGSYYSDSACNNRDVKFESFLNYCSNQISLRQLGEPSAWSTNGETETNWMLAHGSRYQVGVEPIQSNHQPFVKKVKYKTINNVTENAYTHILDVDAFNAAKTLAVQCELYREEGYPNGFDPDSCDNIPFYPTMDHYKYEVARNGTGFVENGSNDILVDRDGVTYLNGQNIEFPVQRGDGVCELEMRVYKKDINQTNLKPLIAFHGGAWRFRSLGVLGLEAEISSYTEQGYIVFLPFYRLSGEDQGSKECNGAIWDNILEDAESALDWVKANGTNYGAKVGDVDLLGQSAGAYLAAYLANYRITDVGKAILHYPATDLRHFIEQYNQGQYSNAQGRVHIEKFLGIDFETVREGNNPYIENLIDTLSLTNLVAANSNARPIYTLHGLSDGLMPADQSSKLCAAYGGPNTLAAGDYSCGNSRMSLIANAGHAFNICIPGYHCTSNIFTAAQKVYAARIWAYGNTSSNNALPTANAGSDKNVSTNQSVTIAGSGSDSDGYITSYHWQQIAGTSVSISGSTQATMSFVSPSISQNTETLSFRLTVTDNKGAQSTDTINVNVIKPNILPTANAGSDRNILRNQNTNVTGSGNDPDGTISSYKWTQVSGPTVTLLNSTSSTVKFKAPYNSGIQIVLQLKVTDNRGGTATDTIKLTTISSSPPPGGGGCQFMCK